MKKVLGLVGIASFLFIFTAIGVAVVKNNAQAIDCTRVAPVVQISPAYTSVAGTSVYFGVDIINQDYTSAACGTSNFNMAVSGLPAGFTVTGIPTNTGAYPPGHISPPGTALYSYVAKITSPVGAPDGLNNFTISISDPAVPIHVASGSSAYIVGNPINCAHYPPPVYLARPIQNGAPGQVLNYNAVVYNIDNPGCANTNFNVSVSNLPAGFTSSTAPSLNIRAQGTGGNGYGQSGFTITSPSNAANGTYTFSVNISDGTNTAHNVTTTGTYIVGGCIRHAPTVSVNPTSFTGTAGVTKSYAVAVTNNDTAPCGSATFRSETNFVGNLNLGFIPTTALLGIQPGQTGTMTLTVTPPAGAADGAHDFTILVDDVTSDTLVNSIHSYQAAATYIMNHAVACTTGRTAVSISPTQQNGYAGQSLTYVATVKNTDSSGCGSTTFNVWGDGGLTFSSNYTYAAPTKVTLAPGETQTVNIILTSPTNSINGSLEYVFVYAQAQNDQNHFNWDQGFYKIQNDTSGCTRTVPTMSVNPTSQTGGAGQILNYTVTLKNNDSSACVGTTNFVLNTFGLPTGFTNNYPSIYLTPGQTGTGVISVTSPTTVANGSYNFTFTAVDYQVQSSHYTNNPGTYVVSNLAGCTRATPTVVASPTSQTMSPGQSSGYVVSVTNNDIGNCGDSAFTLYAAGLSIYFTTNSPIVTMAPQQTHTTDFTISAPTTIADGVNNFQITAKDDTIAAHSGNNVGFTPVTLTVSNSVVCSRVQPTISVSPTSQVGAAGSTKTYTLTISNKDTVGCASTTFATTTTGLPSDFTVVSSPSTISIAPTTTGTVTMSVTSPTTATDSVKYFNISATDTANFSSVLRTATASYMTYTVNNTTNTCTRSNPTVAVSPTSNSGIAGQQLLYSVKITNNDPSNCGSSNFNLTTSNLPSGYATFVSLAQPIAFASGETKTVSVYITSPSSAQNSTNNFTITATDATVSNHSGNATATYVLSNPVVCTRVNPSLSLSPTSQTINSGGNGQYDLTVTNNDPTECLDSAYSFAFSNYISGLVFSDVVTGAPLADLTVSPKQSKTIKFNVKVNPVVNAGIVGFTLTATNNKLSTQNSSVTGRATVFKPCVRNTPGIYIDPNPQTGVSGQILTYTIKVINTDDPNTSCDPTTFNLTVTGLPTGFTASNIPVTTDGLPSDISRQYYLQIQSPVGFANSTNNFNFNVLDPLVTNHSATIVGTYVVSNPVTCTRTNPTVSVSPTSNTGVAGSVQSYTVTVTNKDSSGCANSTFYISPSAMPSGFGGTSSSLTLAPQVSNFTTISVTSPSSATNGTNTFNIHADDSVLSGHTGSTQATYVVNNPVSCTRQAPTVSVSPLSQTGVAGQTFSSTVTVKNNDSAGCATSSFFILPTGPPNGSTGGVTLAPQATGISTVTYYTPSNYANGTYNVVMAVSDSSVGAAHSASATATYTISNPTPTCTRATPVVSSFPIDTNTAAAGTGLWYVIRVANGDSAGCAASTFTLSATNLPSGFTTSNPLNVTVGPQSIGGTNFLITSPSSASPGTYTFTGTGVEVGGANRTGTPTTITYIVSTPTNTCTRQAPTVSVSPLSQTGVAGQTFSSTVTVKNNDSAGCATSSFFILPTGPPNGSTGGVTLAPQATGISTVTYYTPSNYANGTYNVVMAVSDSSVGAAHSASATATYTISNPTPTCTRATPVVSSFPIDTNTAAAGTGLWYVIRVANGDSAGCAASTFTLSATNLPSGFTTSNPLNVTVGPQSIGGTNFLITSPSSASPGTYTFTGTGVEVGGANRTGTPTTITYIVSTPTNTCTRQAPTVSVSPLSQTGVAGQTFSSTVTVKNNDSAGCATSSFFILPTGPPNGSTGGVTLAPQATGISTVTYYTPSNYANGTYNVVMAVSDSSVGAAHSASATATYTISNPTPTCTRATPVVSSFPIDTNTAAAGTGLWYVIRVANGDSAGCAASTFTLSATNLPSGFTTSNPLNVTVGPQSIGGTNFLITSPSSASPGTYTFTGTGVEVGGANRTGTPTTITYIVSTPTNTCTRQAPTVSVSPLSQTGVAGQTFSSTVTVKNNDSAGCATSSFFILPTGPPNGSTGGVTLAPQATGISTVTYYTPSNYANGTYNVVMAVSDSSVGAAHSASATATYTISNPTPTCTRATPVVQAFTMGSNSTTPGTGLWYLVRIINYDSVGCASSTYSVSTSSLPAGFTSSGTLTYTVDPQSIMGSNFLITSPTSATNGTYTFTSTATETGGTGRTASGTGTYIVSGAVLGATTYSDGSIVCPGLNGDKTCYLISNGKKAAFTSEAVFLKLGFSFANVIVGDVSTLESLPNIE